MRKKFKRVILITIVSLFMVLVLTACSDKKNAELLENSESLFIEVERSFGWRVVYHRETRVMYAVSNGGYNAGNFTVLVNADGTPMIHGGETDGQT